MLRETSSRNSRCLTNLTYSEIVSTEPVIHSNFIDLKKLNLTRYFLLSFTWLNLYEFSSQTKPMPTLYHTSHHNKSYIRLIITFNVKYFNMLTTTRNIRFFTVRLLHFLRVLLNYLNVVHMPRMCNQQFFSNLHTHRDYGFSFGPYNLISIALLFCSPS